MIFKSKYVDKSFFSHLSRNMFDIGYERCMDEHHILYGDDAKRLIDQVMNPKPISEKQKKFIEECLDIAEKTKR